MLVCGLVFKTNETSQGVWWVRFPHVPANKFNMEQLLGLWLGVGRLKEYGNVQPRSGQSEGKQPLAEC